MKLVAMTVLVWLCLIALVHSPQRVRQITQTTAAPAQTPFPNETFKSNLLGSIPAAWRARLVERLEAFLAAERNQAWNQVEELLGELYTAEADDASNDYDLMEKYKYSPEQKKWMMEKVKAHPILSYEIKGISWDDKRNASSKTLKTWYLTGQARYSETADKIETTIIVYHYNGDWFFLPEIQDECGATVFQPPPEFSEQEKAESLMPRLSFAPQPDLPIQIFEVAEPVSVVREWPCSSNQQVAFKVRNISGKKIATYYFRIEDSRGRLINAGGTTVWLPPGQVFSDSGAIIFSRRPCVLFFERIEFEDGTKWKAKQSRKRA